MSNSCALCDTCVFSEPRSELYYEIHITVNNSENFVSDCYELGIKPIIIDMGEDVPAHVMTSATVKGNDQIAFTTANGFANAFRDRGYEVLRMKIETVPWHPCASHPSDDQYFETHFAIRKQGDNYLLNEILKTAPFLHRSRNLLKRGGDLIQMVTFRLNKINSTEFLSRVEQITNNLEAAGLKLEKVITEFALYDTNVKMDEAWLRSTSRNRN